MIGGSSLAKSEKGDACRQHSRVGGPACVAAVPQCPSKPSPAAAAARASPRARYCPSILQDDGALRAVHCTALPLRAQASGSAAWAARPGPRRTSGAPARPRAGFSGVCSCARLAAGAAGPSASLPSPAPATPWPCIAGPRGPIRLRSRPSRERQARCPRWRPAAHACLAPPGTHEPSRLPAPAPGTYLSQDCSALSCPANFLLRSLWQAPEGLPASGLPTAAVQFAVGA